ncbi:MAG: hypothetical protein ABIR68_12875 [Ilumatobacteraceae bacterium]
MSTTGTIEWARWFVRAADPTRRIVTWRIGNGRTRGSRVAAVRTPDVTTPAVPSPMPRSAAPATTDVPVPYVLGGPLRRPSGRGVAAVVAVLLVIAIPVRGLFKSTGSSMEEGFMLVFPKRLLAGDVPNVDYLHLYGPFSIHVLAGWYELFGYTLQSERTFGLLQHTVVIFGIFALTRAWGRRMALISALAATFLVLTPIGLSALAWEGGVALAVWSVVLGVRALYTDGREQLRATLGAGLLAGFALGYRPDLVLALALVHGWLLWRSRRWRPVAAGLVVGLVPVLVHLAMAGLGASVQGMVLDPVFKLRPGRELPRPPSWGHIDGALQAVAEGPADAPWWRFPALSANHQLFLWFFTVVIVAIGLVVLSLRWVRHDGAPRHIVLLAGSLLGLGMLPQAVQRPDSTHLAWGSCVSMALLPCAIAELWSRRRPHLARHQWLVAGAAIAVVLGVVCPFYTYRYYLLDARIAAGNKPGGFEVARGDRIFYFGNQPLQEASQDAIDELAASSKPGERLFVGPADLSRTIYSDVVFYYLFPELEPATYFIEMDPGLADKAGSRLAADVTSADWVLLTNFWTGWYEPNASSSFGSDAPNQVVASQFCLVGNYVDALVLLYHRCAIGDGVSPAGIGLGAVRRADLDHELLVHGAG